VDLTEVKRSEAARREVEARARKMVEHSADLVVLLQGDRIVYVNPAGVRMLQALSASAVIGCGVHDIFHPFSMPLIEARLALLRETPGSTAPAVRERIVTRASNVLDVETSAVSFVQDGETIIQLTCRDLTARLAIERELAELRSRLEQALAERTRGP
jgi:PAS domain S-box-containing protein